MNLNSPSLQDLIGSVRDLLNQSDATNSFWTDVEITRYINEAIRIYFAELVMNNEGHFLTVVPLDITANQELITLPSDFFDARALYKTITQGYVLLPYRNNFTEGFSTNGGSDMETYLPEYHFEQNSLVLRPVPNFSQTAGLRLEYYQFPLQLLNGGDVMTSQISPVFKQLIEMYAVYKAKLKESLVTGVRTHDVAAENLRDLYKNFKDSVTLRSKAVTAVIPFNPESEGL